MPRFRFPFPRSHELHRDIEDELEFHLEQAIAALEREGASPAEARAEANARLGARAELHAALFRIDHRSMLRSRLMATTHEFTADVRFALRRLRRRPTLGVVTVLTLALGIGTALTFLAATDAILIRPLPIHDPDGAVTLWRTSAADAAVRTGLAPGTIRDLAEETATFAAVAGAQPYSHSIERDGEPVSIGTWRVTEGFFDVLHATPAAGRLLAAEDFVAGAPPTLVVSFDFWQSWLGGDPSAVGRYERLDGDPYLVVGVLPPDFPYAEGRQFYAPHVVRGAERESRLADYWSAYARLRPGVELPAAAAELRMLAARSDARAPASSAPRGLDIVPLSDALLGAVRARLGLLLVAALLLLAMATANASSLMVADTMGRSRELAVRASVGAGRGRIVRQLVTEAAVLALAAGMLGTALGAAGLRLFRAWAPSSVPRLAELGVDGRVVGIGALVTIAIAALVGVAAARGAATADLHDALKEAADGGGTVHARRFRALLVTTQVALAMLLLSSGGLLLRSWIQLSSVDQGYRAAGVVGIESHVWGAFPTPTARAEFGRELTTRLAQLPGVEAAAIATTLPLAPTIGREDIELRRTGTSDVVSAFTVVGTPGLLDVLGITLVKGRGFADTDDAAGERVVILGASAARRLFPDRDAVGETIELADTPARSGPRRVIGVARDARFQSLERPAALTVYLPHAQEPSGSLYLTVRTTGSAPAALPALRRAVRELLPAAALNEVVLLEDETRRASTPRRFAALLVSSFSVVALVLTAVGVFGLLAQLVRLRQRELGVRLALGAWPAQLRRMVVREGLRLTGVGVGIGLALFVLGSGVLRSQLYEVPVRDPVTLGLVTLILLAAAACSSWWPGTLATRVDPMRSLRAE